MVKNLLSYLPMKKNLTSGPREVFFHLLGFASLYVSVITLIALLFAYTDYLFPDRLDFYLSGTLDQIRWSSSVLIIIFPVFIFISWMFSKEFAQAPEKREQRFRKWLIYFTLFVAAVAIIIDLIMLVFNFYSGELTVRFFWKILIVLLMTAGVFGYYREELNRSDRKIAWFGTWAWITSAIVAVALVGGFLMVGSPATQRARRFDDQRAGHLQSLQWQIVNYWQQKSALPVTLDDLRDSLSGFVPPRDPETDASYEYGVVDEADRKFQLCATFKTSSNLYRRSINPLATVPERHRDFSIQNWDHEGGRVCFERLIDLDLYSKYPVKLRPVELLLDN